MILERQGIKGKYIIFYINRKKKKAKDLHSFLSKIKKNGLCIWLNIYFCAKELGYSTEHWARAREQDLGSTLPVSTTPSAWDYLFCLRIFLANAPSEIKRKKYPGSGRDLMMSFKKCFVCFISVHLRKGINLSCVVLSAGSRGFPCPWFTGGGRSLHILWSAHPVGLAWSLSFGPRIRCYFWSEDICSQLPTQFNRILRYIC